MKENGMNKLIELFNKHIEENTGQKYYLNERDVKDKLDSLLILRYFIKWLVDNDKIDLDKAMKLGIPCFVNYDKGEIISVYDVDFYKQLLMLLATSDTPIDDLISMLK